MALQMNYIDEFGDIYPESYWKVVQTNISQAEKNGMILFYGYADQARKGKRVVGIKQYNIDPVSYEIYFDADALNPDGKNPASVAYGYAKLMNEHDGRSFFETAVDV